MATALVATEAALAETELLATELNRAIRREAAGYAGKAARHGVKGLIKFGKKAMPKYMQALRAQSRLHKAAKKGRRRKHAGERNRPATSKRAIQTYQNNLLAQANLNSFELGSNIPTGFNEGQRHSDRIWVNGVNVRFTCVINSTNGSTNLRLLLVNASSPNLGFGQQLFKDVAGGTGSGIDYATVAAANTRDTIITPVNTTAYGVLHDRVHTFAASHISNKTHFNLWIPIKQYFHYGDQILPNLRLHWFHATPSGSAATIDLDLQSHLFFNNKN